MYLISFDKPTTGNIFADLMLWLVSITSSVALGVVLFTLFLKLITLPFDFMSRFSMRKNSIKMEQMRPELERLQQQYAGNKELYNQKMMALYKKNGYSMFGACLPTIVTLVIFIIAINGFNAYSRYQNKQYFYDMSVAYDNVIYAGLEIDGEYVFSDNESKAIKVNDEKILATETATPDGTNIVINKQAEFFTVETTGGYIRYKRTLNADGDPTGAIEFEIIETALDTATVNPDYNNGLKDAEGRNFSAAKAAIDAERAGQEDATEFTAREFLEGICGLKAAEVFRANGSGFLWVKNIWVTDSPTKNPVEKDYTNFKNAYGEIVGLTPENYPKLISGLQEEQTAANGYFILVALTALSSLLMQLVMSKSQKAQMELQTVDGQGAQTQKIMTWMMPIMMAVFAFMYTAAFSIYIILSSLISLFTTLLINVIADRKFRNKGTDENQVIRGRVYVPKEEEKPAKPVKKSKAEKEREEDGFLSGLADKKKRPRGRLK